jgi:hypothetical protein
MRPILRAALVAGTLSGIPSTLHALATRRDPLESTRAAGTLLRPSATNHHELFAAGGHTPSPAALSPELPSRRSTSD